MTFSRRVRETGIDLNRAVVIGSGLLDQIGVREAADIDLVVTKDLFDELAVSERFEKAFEFGSYVLKDNATGLEVWTDWSGVGYEGLLADTVVLDEVQYVSIDYLKKWKREKGRPKDIKDIELINDYERKRS